MTQEQPDDYWDKDGKPNALGNEFAAAVEKNLDKIILEKPNPQGFCHICFDPANRVSRKLVRINSTDKKGLPITFCPECDHGALDNARRQSQ